MRKAKSIQTIHSEVAGIDIALSSDAPLTLALDNRVDTPRVGRLAATPRSYASGELFPKDLRPLFIAVTERTELSWKQALRAVERVVDCWDTTGSLGHILTYEEFDSSPTRRVVELLGELDSSYSKTANMTVSPDSDVAVVDEDRLSALDRSILPEENEYIEVDGFENEHVQFPELDMFPSASAIVSTVVDQISSENAGQFGVVLVEGSNYSSLLESALEAREIPFSGGPGFEDDPDIRAFLRLLEITFGGSAQRVGEIEDVLTAAEISLPTGLDEVRVDSISRTDLGAYADFEQTAASGTFGDVLDSFEQIADTHLEDLRGELERVNLLSADVTEDRLTQLQYYLDTITVPTDTGADEGVLLAGANSTAYVDRPIVFYLGLGTEWARTPPDYPWVDKAAFRQTDLARFERLLQNGQRRHYFVQESAAGSEVTPCVYLRRLIDESFDSFGDLAHTTHRTSTETTDESPFAVTNRSPPPAPSPTPTVSQSSLRRLANCPRDEYFKHLVDTPSNLAMERGNAIHEAAEIHVADPSVIETNREAVLDAMCALVNPYVDDAKRDVERTKLDVGLAAVTRYLDARSHSEASYETYSTRDRDNDLAARLGVSYDSSLTERWFASESLGLRGFVDLLQNPDTVVDYKTGKMSSPSDLLKDAEIDPVAERPNFQALVYLAKHREERPDRRLEIQFVHLLQDLDAAVAGTPPDIEELVSTVRYVPQTFGEFVAGEETFAQLTDFADSNDRCKVLNKLGYERYREFFQTHEFPMIDEDPPQRADAIAAFTRLAKSVVGDYKYVSDGCELIAGDLETTPAGYVLKPDLDAFEAFVEEQLAALETYRRDRFPVAYRDDGPTWDRVDYPDLMLSNDD
jgi:hypothetical protein